MILLHKVEQGSEAWHELRNKLYTGSGADKLLAHPDAVKIVDGVVSKYALTEVSGFGGNFYTERGHLLELQALDLYAKIYRTYVAHPGFLTNIRYPECGYSPDGIDTAAVWKSIYDIDETTSIVIPAEHILLEVKCFNKEKHLKLVAGDVAFKILAQIYFGMFITGIRRARLIAYNPYFAKKMIDGVPNPDYDPKKALKVIDIPYRRNIFTNFKRILGGGVHEARV